MTDQSTPDQSTTDAAVEPEPTGAEVGQLVRFSAVRDGQEVPALGIVVDLSGTGDGEEPIAHLVELGPVITRHVSDLE